MSDDIQAVQKALISAVERWADGLHKEVIERIARVTKPLARAATNLLEASRRWSPAIAVVCQDLPQRGWYLTGDEPITFICGLAQGLEAGDWDRVDALLLDHTASIRVDHDHLERWLTQEGVPPYTVERVRMVLEACESESHTVAAVLGMTATDELSHYLYDRRAFTTKRGKQPRPQIAVRSSSSRRSLTRFAAKLTENFGVVHKDVTPWLLDDENYFNRAAIVHGMIKRPYGPKDSAKIKLIFLFLIFGAESTVGDSDE